MGDVESLARCIETAVIQGGDIGSRTALLPYSRDRYLENHGILAAADKLHKLYSSTFEPIVWARSVGLEVINELDVVKAALMMFAGSDSVRRSKPGRGWDLTATYLEGMNGTVDGARFVGQSLVEMLRVVLGKAAGGNQK